MPLPHPRILILIACLPALGQGSATSHVREDTAPPPSARFPAAWYPAESDAASMNIVTGTEPPVPGVPFTATTEMTVGMPAGAPQAPSALRSLEVTVRDRAGNMRFENHSPEGPGMPPGSTRVEVNDVVHHCKFEWQEPARNPDEQVAQVRCSPLHLKRWISDQPDPMEARMTRATPDLIRDRFQTFQMEPLGVKTILGVQAFGQRQTKSSIDAQGRETVAFTMDLWWSPELKQILSSKSVNGRIPSFEIKELRRGDPDPSLFYPPAGWRIQNASAPAR